MTRRLLILALPLLLLMPACSDDDPTSPGSTRTGVGFDDLVAGLIDEFAEAGFIIEAHDDGDPVHAAAIADGDMGLTDSVTGNGMSAKFEVYSSNQQLFTFDGIDLADLTTPGDPTPGSQVYVEGYRGTTKVGERFYSATTSTPETQGPFALDGKELTHLDIEITSVGDDDFCVGFLELSRVASRILDFEDVSTGAIMNIFNGDFVVAREAGTQQASVTTDDDIVWAEDDNTDLIASVFTVARNDGGSMNFETLVALNLEGDGPTEVHADSRIRIEGYLDGTMVAADEFQPYSTDLDDFHAANLADLEIDQLRVEIKSICGTFKCDDMAVVGLILDFVD